MSDYRLVRGLESGRILLQLDEHHHVVIRDDRAGHGQMLGQQVYLNVPNTEAWDGELSDEESVLVAKIALGVEESFVDE